MRYCLSENYNDCIYHSGNIVIISKYEILDYENKIKEERLIVKKYH